MSVAVGAFLAIAGQICRHLEEVKLHEASAMVSRAILERYHTTWKFRADQVNEINRLIAGLKACQIRSEEAVLRLSSGAFTEASLGDMRRFFDLNLAELRRQKRRLEKPGS
ncbi:MAG: hypothetical protein LBW85_03050 [Deltaproteobacteria bacterium]|jgi:hypothetical protein|nr:hypothetical protein [Deltaproteobacteria bacterium]